MRFRHALVTSVVATTFVLCSSIVTPAEAGNDKINYQAQISWTSYGIPHIKAEDWGGLGYGYGYAFAKDNICVLARDVLVANGTQSRYFGPGAGSANVISDSVYAMVNSNARVAASWGALDQDTRDLLTGYADGYNRYLRDTGVANIAADCRGAAWVQPLTGEDIYRALRKLMVRASTGNFLASIFGAAPPAPAVAFSSISSGEPMLTQAATVDEATQQVGAATLPDFSPELFGSNAVALGSGLTGGAGALLGNPHFPWRGIERFYSVHLTIPGRYDAMGASIYGFPMINIGFNRHLAWSHTVSTARRFIVRELTLAPGNPTAYVYEGNVVAMQPEVTTIDVMVAPGVIAKVSHTFYQTQFGPILIIPPAAPWTTARAYALTDVNIENTRAFQLYREMATSRSIEEFSQSLNRHVALPWVNTIAADAKGNAYYGDITAVPNITNAQLNDAVCKGSPFAQALSAQRVYTLNGALAKCDPGTDADAPVPGIFGPGNLPSLVRRDYVQNSNDSYWLSNPSARLEGYSRLIGADELQRQNFRTRLGITQINDRMAGTDDVAGSGFTRQWLQDVLFGNRHYSAEIMLDDVLTLCEEEDNAVVIAGGATINVAPACSVLAQWDRRNYTSSVGTHVWTDFWSRASGTPVATLYAVPFDPADPVNTPRGVNLANAATRTKLMGDLALTTKFFADNNIPLDREWGKLQFDVRNNDAIPIHGGSGGSGVYNAIGPVALVPGVGYPAIANGSSYIQAVTFKDSGPDARAIVTYSQSTDPANPHYADMTKLFSGYGWVTMPFAEGDIRRDPNLQTLHLHEQR
jgi:acyl-homoserine-lactone acylase